MSFVRLTLALAPLAVAARSSATAPHPVANHAGAPPPPMPAHMVAVDFDAMVAHHVLDPIELPVVARDEVSVLDDLAPAPAGQIRISNAMPGGWSETIYADGAHRLWIVARANDMPHVPDGVIISATRVFETTLTIPPGYVLGGRIEIVGNPDSLPATRAPIG